VRALHHAHLRAARLHARHGGIVSASGLSRRQQHRRAGVEHAIRAAWIRHLARGDLPERLPTRSSRSTASIENGDEMNSTALRRSASARPDATRLFA
jgi:hypothetical protein